MRLMKMIQVINDTGDENDTKEAVINRWSPKLQDASGSTIGTNAIDHFFWGQML